MLNEKLENDLLSMGEHANTRSNGDAGSSNAPTGQANTDLETKGAATKTTPIPFTPSADTSILPIVTSQRDRFRQRNAELEEASLFSPLRSITDSLNLLCVPGTAQAVPHHFGAPRRDQVPTGGQPQAVREGEVHAELPRGGDQSAVHFTIEPTACAIYESIGRYG